MSQNSPKLFSTQFATIMQLLLQQKQSRLRPAVTEAPYVGETANVVDQVAPISMNPVTTRFAPIVRTDADFDLRWVTPSDFDLAQQVDSFDKLKEIINPESHLVQSAVAAANRQIDTTLITAFTGINKTGKAGATNTSPLAANQIAANFGSSGPNVGMSVAKLRRAKRLLMAAEVDLESDPLYCAMAAAQHEDLLSEAQVVSTDFNDRPVLVDGKITMFFGIQFIHTELLAFSSPAIRSNPVWARSGMHLGLWNDIITDVSQRKDLTSLPWQAYVKLSLGATRLEEKKIIEILSSDP